MKKPKVYYRIVAVNEKTKKAKQKRNAPLPLDHCVQFAADEIPEAAPLFEEDENGMLSFPHAIAGSIKVLSRRDRQSGSSKEKVVVQSPVTGKTASPWQVNNLKAQFDVLAAIDTNNCNLDGKWIAVTSIFCSTTPIKELDSLTFLRTSSFVTVDVNESFLSKTESLGWAMFMLNTLRAIALPDGMKLGLIVDHDLDSIPAINSRAKPYYRDYFLPENIGLIYASSDTGEDLPNVLMKRCDSTAKELSNQIASGELELPDKLGGGTENYSGIVRVNYKNDS